MTYDERCHDSPARQVRVRKSARVAGESCGRPLISKSERRTTFARLAGDRSSASSRESSAPASRGAGIPRGFTLLEVLIAIALVLMLAGTMFTFLDDMLATRQRTLRRAMQQRAAATLIERVEADLLTALVGDGGHAGVQGDATHVRLLTRGVMPQLAGRGLDDPAALGDLQAVEYRFDAARRHLEAGKSACGESVVFAPLGGEVAHARFRYLDGRQWKDSFDSLALNCLPTAIEVAVWFNPWPGDLASDNRAAKSQPMASETFGIARAATRPGNFDEQAYADASESSAFRPPPADRVRVIVIPDSAGDEHATSGSGS